MFWIYSYKKDVLEYVEIVATQTKSTIHYNGGHSIDYVLDVLYCTNYIYKVS